MLHGKSLYLDMSAPEERVIGALKALASLPRWRLLQSLAGGGQSINDLAEALNMPASTVAAQVKILEEAELLRTELRAASHGLQKVCTRTYDNVLVTLPSVVETPSAGVEIAMPIGAYTDFDVAPTCGLATETGIIGYLDDPVSFYEPERVRASLLWFRSGYVEYNFPNRLPEGAVATALTVSMEICSEAPLHNDNWPSDITVWVNGRALGTWTSPGDFGGERGRLTPAWWDEKDSQFGLLKRWSVTPAGAFLDGHALAPLTIDELGLESERVTTVRIGVQRDALHMGGLNLFGRAFGNYPQDLVLRLQFMPGRRK